MDRGRDKGTNVHIGSEHFCDGGMICTYDTGRFDRCPICGSAIVSEDAEIIETMTPDEAKKYIDTYEKMLSSEQFATIRDPNSIGVFRLLDTQDAIAERLKITPEQMLITFRIKQIEIESEDFKGKTEIKTIYEAEVRKRPEL